MRAYLSRSSLRSLAVALFVTLLVAAPRDARGDPPKQPVSAELQKAREEFLRGGDLANQSQWGEALAAFERSEKLRRHSVTTFDIGACQRAMGSYTLARETLGRALSDNDDAGGAELPQTLVTDAKGYLAEIDGILATVTVHLSPADTRIAVDGRPLLLRPPRPGDDRGLSPLVAGVRDPGPGEAPPASSFRVLLNPGTRVFTLSRKGFSDSVVRRTLLPGAAVDLDLALDRLPATIHVLSSPPRAVITVDAMDVGLTPIDLTRPAGSYRFLIRESGYVPYDTKVVAEAGEELTLSPTLPKEKTALTKRWWFWASAATVVAGGVLLTYALTRSPQTPAYDGGSTGLVVPSK